MNGSNGCAGQNAYTDIFQDIKKVNLWINTVFDQVMQSWIIPLLIAGLTISRSGLRIYFSAIFQRYKALSKKHVSEYLQLQ